MWARHLPSRYANTTHGTYLAKEQDVAAQRKATAEKLLAKIDTSKCSANEVNAILEVISYCKDEPFCGACKKICGGYLANLNAMDDATLEKSKNEIKGIKHSYDVLRRNNVIGNCPLYDKIDATIRTRGWNKRR